MSDDNTNDQQPRPKGTALVIGGSGGLGAEISKRLVSEFDTVVVTYRANAARADKLVADLNLAGRAECCALDVCDRRATEAVIADIGRRSAPLSAVVFASGVDIAQPFVAEISAEQWREVIESELIGFINVTAATLPIFRAQKAGVFVNIGTFGTHWYPPGDALSAVPKAGTEQLCRAIAREEGRFGIRANVVAPGIIEAGIGARLISETLSPEVWKQLRKRVALRRFGEPRDIAEAVAFLASERSRYITGVTLIVDGGMHI